MSVSSQKVVSKPIGLHEIANLLHVKAVDVGAVCCAKTKINPWSKHKPLDFPDYPELTEQQMASVNYGLDLTTCAMGTMNGQSVGGGINALNQLGVQAQTWIYHSPADSSTAKYRLTDFNGYKHKGKAYRWPVRFRPVIETIAESAHENVLLNFGANGGTKHLSWSNITSKIMKTWGREAQNTKPTYTGIHVSSWGYGGLTTHIWGDYEIYIVDSNNRKVWTTGDQVFELSQGLLPDPNDSLNRIGISINQSGHWGGKSPYTLHMVINVTRVTSTAQTSEKGQLQINPIFSFTEYASEWPAVFSAHTGIMAKIPVADGDWAENDHAYEKELLHYTDVSTGSTVYCTDPMFVLILEDGSGNQIGTRYWFPSGSNGDFITPWDIGLGVYGDLREFVITGLYMFYCNKAVVFPNSSQSGATFTDTINTTNTVIFPAPFAKWDYAAIKKS